WVQEAKLQLDEPQQGAVAGGSGAPAFGVGINGTHALFGLPGAHNAAGTVLHYQRRSTGWVRTGELSAFDRQSGARFGSGFHDHDGQLWISAPGADDFGAIYAFTFDPDTETFGSATKIRPGDGTDVGDGFGIEVASSGNLAIVGQPRDDSSLGSVVILENRGGTWTATDKLVRPVERRALASLSDVDCNDDGMADQFTCDQVDVLSFMPLDEIGGTDRGIQTNDVWGWTDPQTGREYAIVGRTDGTSFIDISNPSSPIYLGNLAKTPGSQTNSWRDIKVFDNHAFVVADGAGDHGMQVFDLTRLRDVTDAPAEFEPDALYDGIASAHNIVINEETGTAYAVGSNSGGETCGGGLHMIDINSPKDPSFLGCFQDTNTGYAGTGYSHDAMCINYDGPDTEHAGKEICFGSNENNLSIADVTDKDNPVALSHANYPSVAYAHQGWITEDHRYFYMNDEGDEMTNQQAVQEGAEEMAGTRTLIWDVSDLDDPVMIKEHFGNTLTIDHNLYIKDDLMYQSNYVSGLRVFDISDPENPEEVGYLDTVPWDESVVFDGSWSNYPFFESGTIVVSSGQEGVFFLKYRRPELVP
ncbi:MAG: choice-of-anchor B family protein, partial [Gemmatimonadetes bacterium]|nr:choice-of-anchor B family protein [Gemmatimonadota bacterium]